ncbi:hypothetical protein F9C07_11691 [Aspergillus flavus]|uniref:Uncharacterized protein n=1 Tax=Aspergillus flavus (strain ATCC 200026 / FGSC A1120 / IAM 13836 / NRRL 3357 / JCM 12722 / SRRC 167) TaxID=332952 RepID=A0A7U2N308_ASPFN|nr:hypothetical protein F9C07_11691 [Aspergillus flavus]
MLNHSIAFTLLSRENSLAKTGPTPTQTPNQATTDQQEDLPASASFSSISNGAVVKTFTYPSDI